MPPVARDVARLLARADREFGAAAFLQVGEQRLSFGEFAARVRSTAATLGARGLQRGERVAVLLPRVIDEAVVLLAAMVAGGVAVPVHGKLKDDQVRHVLDDCQPQFVVTSGLRTIALQDPAAVLAGHRLLDVERDLAIAADANPTTEPADVELDAMAPAVLLYTSGSTGQAKAIVQTHDNLTRGAAIVAGYLGLDRQDHVLTLLSFSFDYGLNQLLSALHVGCRLTAADHLGVGELATLLQTHRPTGLVGVPSLWHEVAVGLTGEALTAEHGASLRYVTNSGGALRVSDSRVLRRRWPHVQVFAMYGLTEAFRSAFLPPAEFDAHPDSFGYAIDAVAVAALRERPEADLVVARRWGTPVGTGLLFATGAVAGFHMLGVPPEARRTGVAGAIMLQLLHEARRRGLRHMALQASPMGEDLYRKLGFEHSGDIDWHRCADDAS